MHLRNNVLTVDEDLLRLGRTQRNVKNRAILRDVDLLPGEHRLDALTQAALLRKLQQQLERLVRNAVLRVVEEQAAGLGGQARAATRRPRRTTA